MRTHRANETLERAISSTKHTYRLLYVILAVIVFFFYKMRLEVMKTFSLVAFGCFTRKKRKKKIGEEERFGEKKQHRTSNLHPEL